MSLQPPKRRDLLAWENGTSEVFWEIGAPAKNSLSWSIVLSYLISVQDSKDFKQHIEILIGDKEEAKEIMKKKNMQQREVDFNKIKKRVNNFNPFKNRHVFYFDTDMIMVLRIFDLRLNRRASELQRSKGSSAVWNDLLKLETASLILNRTVEVYVETSSGKKFFHSFPCDTSHSNPHFTSDRILLLKHQEAPYRKTTKDIFSFVITLERAHQPRCHALAYILKSAKLSEDIIHQTRSTFSLDNNFLTFILQKRPDAIFKLYGSPYFVLKLAEAGFETHPSASDESGFSAFYYAVTQNNAKCLRILYDYESNCCGLADMTVRIPDLDIVGALIKIGESFKSDRVRSNNFTVTSGNSELYLNCSNCYVRFNEFQLQTVTNILFIRQDFTQTAKQDEVLRAKELKSTVISILQNYNDFHYYGTPSKNSEYNFFSDFIKFNQYYENLDNFTCLLFFDNLFMLKQRLSLSNNDLYLDVENSLFLTVLSSKMFPLKNGVADKDNQSKRDAEVLRFIPFCHRSIFQESATDFRKELEKTQIEAAITTKKSDAVIKDCLKNLPEVKDEFRIQRLRKYMDAAMEVNMSDMKGVLTITRALQVIGETLHPSTTSGCVVSYLLLCCLSSKLTHEFFNIRNHCLSHYRANTIQGRIWTENELALYRVIQQEICKINTCFLPVYLSQYLRIEEFFIHKCKDETQKLTESGLYSDYLKIIENRTLKNAMYNSEFRTLSTNVFNYLKVCQNDIKAKSRDLKGVIESLQFLCILIHQRCDIENYAELPSDFPNISSEEEIQEYISRCKTCLDLAFENTKVEPMGNLECPQIENLFTNIRNYKYFSDEELCLVKATISNLLEDYKEKTDFLEKYLKTSNPGALPEQMEKLFETTTKTKKSKASKKGLNDHKKATELLKSIHLTERTLKPFMSGSCEVTRETLENVKYFENISLPADLRGKMDCLKNQKLEFLMKRIELLKSILIDEDEEIKEMWDWGRSDAIKKHTKFLMCQRYMKEMNVRASLEMVLFDCMNILDNDSLRELWTKANYLFSGVNLRDVLSHGCVILETIGGLLDEEDLPFEFIGKMLQLIENGECLRAMADLWQKSKPKNIEALEDLIESSKGDNYTALRGKVKRCSNWKDNLKILPSLVVNH